MDKNKIFSQKNTPRLNRNFFFQLFTSCRLVDRVLEAWEENENEELKPGFHRKGYMGHLTNIANIMVSLLKIRGSFHVNYRTFEIFFLSFF